MQGVASDLLLMPMPNPKLADLLKDLSPRDDESDLRAGELHADVQAAKPSKW